MSKQISPLLRTWYKWKALRLPWRRKLLVGLDLQGNTYWEFRIPGTTAEMRWRRIVQYPRDTHYGEVKVPPQWHQWLRYTRERPPSIQEQHAEVRRQQQIKYLAAEADARWEAKPRLVDAPGGVTGQPVGRLESWAGRRRETEVDDPHPTRTDAVASGEDQQRENVVERVGKTVENEDPWKQHRRGGPSEDWQPQTWSPPTPSKR